LEQAYQIPQTIKNLFYYQHDSCLVMKEAEQRSLPPHR